MFADPERQHDLLWRHICGIRETPLAKNAVVVLGLECNLGFEAHHILRGLQRRGLSNYCALHEGAGGQLGILTTNNSKEAMCIATNDLLAEKRLAFAPNFVSVGRGEREMMNQLADELRHFMIHVEPSRSIFNDARKTYSGKASGRQDDLCIAFQLAVLTVQMWTKHAKYRNYQVG